MAYKCVMVPIDFSDDSLSAFQLAIDYFSGPETSLVLLHVFEPHPDDSGQSRSGDRVEHLRHRMHTLGNSRKEKFKEVRTLIEQGRPADAIVSAARNEGADMVVMGSHGSTSLSKLLFGGTTYEVARKVKCSVLVSRRA